MYGYKSCIEERREKTERYMRKWSYITWVIYLILFIIGYFLKVIGILEVILAFTSAIGLIAFAIFYVTIKDS